MSTGQNNSGNPNWKAILDKIPAEFHNQITPVLQEWDQSVQAKFQEIHSQYEPLKAYKALADHGVQANYAEAAVQLADQMQRDPALIAKQMIETYKLDYVSAQEAAQRVNQSDPNGTGQGENLFGTDDDIFKDPRIQQLVQGMEAMQSKLTEREQQELFEQQANQWEDYLDTLEEQAEEANLPFNRVFVTALAQQGYSGEDAVKEYHRQLALAGVAVEGTETQQTQTQTQQPPVGAPPVMGAAGSVGSGSPDGSVDFGKLPKNDFNALIEQHLRQAAEEGGQ